jgi:hypothetical protein
MSYAVTGMPAARWWAMSQPPGQAAVDPMAPGAPRLLGAFWAGVALLALLAAAGFLATTPVLVAVGMLIAAVAVLPCHLWCQGRVCGPPLFGMYSLLFVPGFAMPLWSSHPSVAPYSEAEQVRAGLSVLSFLVVSTLAWLPWARRQPRLRSEYRVFDSPLVNGAALALMAVGCAFAVLARWDKVPDLDVYYNTVRSLCSGLGMLGTFLAGTRIGRGQMGGVVKLLAYLLLGALFLTAVSSMVLMNAMGYLMTFALGKWLARGRLPVVLLVTAGLALSFLHLGKADMRQKHWGKHWTALSPLQYPAYFREWAGYSAADLEARLSGIPRPHKHTTLMERAGNIHMLMRVQRYSPERVDFLGGRTYAIIPELLVPRFINPEKPRTHEGTYILCVYYGLQSRKATQDTTIGFDLISEAYANFGYPGILAMALVVGTLLGWLTRMTAARPGPSVWLCFALMAVVGLSLSAASAGVCVTSLLQGAAALVLVAACLSSPYRPTTD